MTTFKHLNGQELIGTGPIKFRFISHVILPQLAAPSIFLSGNYLDITDEDGNTELYDLYANGTLVASNIPKGGT